MKQVITILFFTLLTVASFGQVSSKEIKSDTTYLVWDVVPEDWTGGDDSIFYEVRTVTYSNGREETIREAVGDTATTRNYFTNRTADINRQLAQAAGIVIERSAIVRAGRVSNKALTGAGIGSVYAQLDTLFWREYLNTNAAAPTYIQNLTVTQNGTDFAGTFRRMANGNIRFSFNGTNYVAVPYSDTWIRINSYPTSGQSIDLIKVGPKLWKSISGTNNGVRIIPTLQFRKTGN